MAINLRKDIPDTHSTYSEPEIEKELSVTLANGTYNPRTTFHMDFKIANRFGRKAILETFRRSWNGWPGDIVYLTELAMVTNDMCWYFHSIGNDDLSGLYAEMYYKCYDLAYSDFFAKHEQLYFFRCTD